MNAATLTARAVPLVTFGFAAGCTGVQSALDPAGDEAARIALLFWVMTGGALVIWAGVVTLAWYYGRPHEASESRTRDRWLIVGTGVIFPVVVLTMLLAWGLRMLLPLVSRAPEGSLTVEVVGEQWWWRVRYLTPDGTTVELANEIRLPVGAPVQFRLTSDNVIHSFWIPSLGGKMDMIPGRRNRLRLTAGRTGEFRGACAEFCGTSHAWMAFPVVVMERAEFDAWLEQQRSPAASPAPAVHGGQAAFLANGCGACHTVRGSPADGVVGPDLTHVGSRLSLGAGVLGNEIDDFVRWIAETDRVKPGVLMPHFGMLPQDELRALAAYLDSLQ